MFPSVEYFHSIICIYLLPLYVGSGMSWSVEFIVYPMALVWSGLVCGGSVCVVVGGYILVWFVVGLLYSVCHFGGLPPPSEGFVGVAMQCPL